MSCSSTNESSRQLEQANALQFELLQRIVHIQDALARPQQNWFSIKEAAALTGLSPKHIRRATKLGDLACSNVGTKKRPTYRIALEAINKWMDERRVRPSQSKSSRDALVQKYFSKSAA